MEIDEYSEDYDTLIYDDDLHETSDTTLAQLYHLCLEPTLFEVFPHIWKLLLINVVFRVCTQTKPLPLPAYFCHITSAFCGIFVQYCILRSTLFYTNTFIIFCYVILVFTYYFCSTYWPYCLSVLCTLYLIVSEFYFPNNETWAEIRGIHMIIAMKVISIGFDVKKGTIKNLPNLIEYSGYIWCPSNCLFGPWVSFNTYKSVLNSQVSFIDINWFIRIISTTVTAVIFLTLSNCWAYWLIPQSLKWFVAYQEAFSFRSSHYFISYLSESAMVAGGYGHDTIKKKKDLKSRWSYQITQPLAMEAPRSLVQVVVFWNIPMHMWLKNYVFQVCKPIGSFFAVIMTYLISSFLHGFNLKLAAVLLSLGFYTYIEYKFRHKMAVIFDACIEANVCKKCDHLYKNHVYVYLVNFLFSIVAVFHLAYLGCLLETTSDHFDDVDGSGGGDKELFYKWQQLDYSSHLFTVFLYFIYRLILALL